MGSTAMHNLSIISKDDSKGIAQLWLIKEL